MWLNIASASFVSESKYIISSGGQTYSVSRGGIAILMQNSRLLVSVRHGQQGLHWKITDVSVPRDTWFHLGVTWSQNRSLIVYINGTKVAETGSTSYTSSPTNDASGVFMQLGKPNNNDNNVKKGAFSIDEWYFWENALGSEYMTNIYKKYNLGE